MRDKVDKVIVAICDAILDEAEHVEKKRNLVLAIDEMVIVNQLSNLVDARSKLDDLTERERLK